MDTISSPSSHPLMAHKGGDEGAKVPVQLCLLFSRLRRWTTAQFIAHLSLLNSCKYKVLRRKLTQRCTFWELEHRQRSSMICCCRRLPVARTPWLHISTTRRCRWLRRFQHELQPSWLLASLLTEGMADLAIGLGMRGPALSVFGSSRLTGESHTRLVGWITRRCGNSQGTRVRRTGGVAHPVLCENFFSRIWFDLGTNYCTVHLKYALLYKNHLYWCLSFKSISKRLFNL